MKKSNFSWETLVISVSFGAVWIYFLVWLWAGRNQTQLSPLWQLLLLPLLVLLVMIFVKRVQRVLELLRNKDNPTAQNGRLRK